MDGGIINRFPSIISIFTYTSIFQPFGLQDPVEDNFMINCPGKPRIFHIFYRMQMFFYSNYQWNEGFALI
jgi:hypothetical protein